MRTAIAFCRDIRLANKWKIACDKLHLDCRPIDLAGYRWMDEIISYKPSLILLRPPGDTELDKTLFDERVYILAKVLDFKTFPGYEECIIYENKKMLSYFLKARHIDHPPTDVFYHKSEALQYASDTSYPKIFKSSIGASGTGVMIVRNKGEAVKYIKRAFSSRGIPMQIGPNRVTGSPKKWITRALTIPGLVRQKVSQYHKISTQRPKNYIICQEYISHDFEWRAVKIGDSFFAHQKTKYKDKCSGTKGIDFVNSPVNILDFVRQICSANGFHSVAIDMFEHKGKLLVNEIQTIFGHVQDHIMEVDGIPGRYLRKNDEWVFEAGDFNTNESYDLRLEVALKLFEEGKL